MDADARCDDRTDGRPRARRGGTGGRQAAAPDRADAGGRPSDAAARIRAQAYTRRTDQDLVIDNKPGAGGSIAAQAQLGAGPDGRTLLWGLASMTGIPMLQKAPPFQSIQELVPVAMVGRSAFGLFVNTDVPARTVAELVTHARAHPGQLNSAHGTLGEFMAAAQFAPAAGVETTFVPYEGGAQLMPDLINGRVQMNFGPLSSGLAQAKTGKLRLLAVMAAQRSPLAPDVPTLAESRPGAPS